MSGKQARRCRREALRRSKAPRMKKGGQWVKESPAWWYKRLKRGVSRKIIAPLADNRPRQQVTVIKDDMIIKTVQTVHKPVQGGFS